MEERKVYKVLVGKPEGKRPLRSPRHRWEDGIRMDLRETGWGVDWIRLAQNRDRWLTVVNAMMNLRVLAPCGKTTTTFNFITGKHCQTIAYINFSYKYDAAPRLYLQTPLL
jgi:hypothetical protein